MIDRPARAGAAPLAIIFLAALASPAASGGTNEVLNIDTIVKANPLPPGQTGSIVAAIQAGGAALSVLVMRKNPLHHHSHQDHVLFVVRGNGIARLENASGQIETRAIKPGDILALPRGKKHGIDKTGDEDLVFLVAATPLPPGVEETTYDE